MNLRPILEAHGVFFGEDHPLDIEVIAHNLAYINRFAGRVGCYSVAQHSVLVSKALPTMFGLSGLLHDAAEAYLGDIVGPVKEICAQFQELEHVVLDAIDSHFQVDTRHAMVSVYDRRVLVAEARHFDIWNSRSYPVVPLQVDDIVVAPWGAEYAEQRFLAVYHELL